MKFFAVIIAILGVLIIAAWFIVNSDREVSLSIGNQEVSTTTEAN